MFQASSSDHGRTRRRTSSSGSSKGHPSPKQAPRCSFDCPSPARPGQERRSGSRRDVRTMTCEPRWRSRTHPRRSAVRSTTRPVTRLSCWTRRRLRQPTGCRVARRRGQREGTFGALVGPGGPHRRSDRQSPIRCSEPSALMPPCWTPVGRPRRRCPPRCVGCPAPARSATLVQVRRAASIVLGLLAFLDALLTLSAWDAMVTEERLAHEIGDDTAVFAVSALLAGLATVVLLVAFLLVWRWPGLKRRWRDECQLLRDARAARPSSGW